MKQFQTFGRFGRGRGENSAGSSETHRSSDFTAKREPGTGAIEPDERAEFPVELGKSMKRLESRTFEDSRRGLLPSRLYMFHVKHSTQNLYIVALYALKYKLCDVPFLDQQNHLNNTKSAHYKVENYTLLLYNMRKCLIGRYAPQEVLDGQGNCYI